MNTSELLGKPNKMLGGITLRWASIHPGGWGGGGGSAPSCFMLQKPELSANTDETRGSFNPFDWTWARDMGI